MPISAGRSGWPSRNSVSPRLRSSPAKRRFCPALVTARAEIVTPPAVSCARSCMTTVSAPRGMTPPVKMRTACPASTAHERLPCERITDARELRVAVAFQVGKAERPAVHRRVVVPRHVDRRHDVSGEDPAERLPDVNAFGRTDRLEESADQLACAIDRHRIGIVVVGAGDLAQRLRFGHASVPCSLTFVT